MSEKEIIYVLSNPAMPGYVKIGRTSNLENRLKDLDNTSTPLPFECVFAIEVEKKLNVEKTVHDIFLDSRTRKTREFFEIHPDRVISALKMANGIDVTPTQDIVEDDDSQIALDNARKKRERFNFSMINLEHGTVLDYMDDTDYKCEVISNNRVLFEEKEMSLSGSAQEIYLKLNPDRKKIALSGPWSWGYKGERLDEIRQRMWDAD